MNSDTAQHSSVQPRRPRDLSLKNWDRPPYNRWSFQHVREVVPTAPIRASEASVLSAAPSSIDLADFQFTDHRGAITTAREMLDRSWTDGLLVLHNGEIVCESYENGMRPETLHLAQSVSKSVVAAVVGILHHAGAMPLGRTVSEFVPEFRQSAYRDVTIEQLLNMASGVDFPEDITDPLTGIGLMDIAVGWKPVAPDNPNPRTVRELIASLRNVSRPHGSLFDYRSMETEVLGTCIEAAAQSGLCDLISDLLWKPMGAEFDADFGVDPEGYPIADGALSAALRDFGRFGIIYAQDGYANGKQIVPENWVRESRNGDPSMFSASSKVDWPNGAYRYKFWIPNADEPVTLALGIYGQMIYIDPAKNFVGVKLSSWTEQINASWRIDMQNLMRELAAQLSH